MLCAVWIQLTRFPLRVAEQLHTLRALRQPRHLPGMPGEFHGGGALAAVSVLRSVGADYWNYAQNNQKMRASKALLMYF